MIKYRLVGRSYKSHTSWQPSLKKPRYTFEGGWSLGLLSRLLPLPGSAGVGACRKCSSKILVWKSSAFAICREKLKVHVYMIQALTLPIIMQRLLINVGPLSWRTQSSEIMMTTSNGNIFRVTDHLYREFTGHRWIPHGALMASLIWSRINGWVNNREAGDLRRHCAHYDVTVISINQLILKRKQQKDKIWGRWI